MERIDIVKLNSGNQKLDSLFLNITQAAHRATTYTAQTDVVFRILDFINQYPAIKAKFIDRLEFDLKLYIKREIFENKDPNDPSHLVFIRKQEGAKNLLWWLKNGMGNYLKEGETPEGKSLANALSRLREDLDKRFESNTIHNHYYNTEPNFNTTENRIIDKKVLLDEISNSENKFWKGLPMAVVVQHFLIMTTKKAKNGKTFLTNEQLISFLKRGFLNDKNQPIQKINYSNGQRGLVILRFFELWELAVIQYGYPQIKESFIKLVLECFDNCGTYKSVSSWFKPNKIKENW